MVMNLNWLQTVNLICLITPFPSDLFFQFPKGCVLKSSSIPVANGPNIIRPIFLNAIPPEKLISSKPSNNNNKKPSPF